MKNEILVNSNLNIIEEMSFMTALDMEMHMEAKPVTPKHAYAVPFVIGWMRGAWPRGAFRTAHAVAHN